MTKQADDEFIHLIKTKALKAADNMNKILFSRIEDHHGVAILSIVMHDCMSVVLDELCALSNETKFADINEILHCCKTGMKNYCDMIEAKSVH